MIKVRLLLDIYLQNLKSNLIKSNIYKKKAFNLIHKNQIYL